MRITYPIARLIYACFFVFILALTGCESKAYQSSPVNEDLARETLNQALESWKSGEPAALMQDQTPSIVVQDFDWLSGIKLVGYKIEDEGKPVHANLVIKVKLQLQDKKGAKSEKTVTYLVGTAPNLTVFRDSGP